MTRSDVRKEVRSLIKEKHIYGAEGIVLALAEASEDEPYLDEDFLCFLIHYAFKLLRYENEEE